MKRKVEITVEHARLVFAGRQTVSIRADCAGCGRYTTFIPPDRAAQVSGKSLRTIFRAIEDGQLHSLEAGAGALLVCGDSIEQLWRSQAEDAGGTD